MANVNGTKGKGAPPKLGLRFPASIALYLVENLGMSDAKAARVAWSGLQSIVPKWDPVGAEQMEYKQYRAPINEDSVTRVMREIRDEEKSGKRERFRPSAAVLLRVLTQLPKQFPEAKLATELETELRNHIEESKKLTERYFSELSTEKDGKK